MLERFLWAVGGIVSTGVGLLGMVIPIIPGILFLLLAAVCFSRATKPRPKKSRWAYGANQQTYVQQSFVDELRVDLYRQYRSLAQLLARAQRRFKRR